MSKALGTLLLIFAGILVFPVAIGILGTAIGIVVGVFGAVFGAIGGFIGAVFGAIGSMFEGIFGWHWHGPEFFDCNPFLIGAVVIVVAMLVRSRQNNPRAK